MKNVQFIHNEAGEAEYAVMPIRDYRKLVSATEAGFEDEAHRLLTEDKKAVRLPYAGPGTVLDIEDLISYLTKHGINDLAINQRAQTLDKFPKEQAMTLDPIIRREFLVPGSPYANTMQASIDVVDALVSTGRFRRTKKRYSFFNRAVNAIELLG